MNVSGTSPDGTLVEFVELDQALHPFAVATQAHPELKSRPTRPHPLFAAFVRAALDYLRSERLPIEGDADNGVTDTAERAGDGAGRPSANGDDRAPGRTGVAAENGVVAGNGRPAAGRPAGR
jgi:CTP synthase